MDTRTTNDTTETWTRTIATDATETMTSTTTADNPFERHKPRFTAIVGPEGYEANILVPVKITV